MVQTEKLEKNNIKNDLAKKLQQFFCWVPGLMIQ